MVECPKNVGGKGCLFCVVQDERLICCHKAVVDSTGFGWVDNQRICPLALRSNMKAEKNKLKADRCKSLLEQEGRVNVKHRKARS